MMKLGVLTHLRDDPDAAIAKVRALGLDNCQVWLRADGALTDENLRALDASRKRYGIEITGLWIKLPGPSEWNFTEGPTTIGLIPRRWRKQRVRALKESADFAAALKVPLIATHCGFIPENPKDPLYAELIAAVRIVVAHCRRRNVNFCFETGQETPVVLLRCIEDLGNKGVGINLDCANFIGYGKANPVDALDVIGRYVVGVHAKDAVPPPNGRELGHETPIGKGHVDFRAFLAKLKKIGYRGTITIEREVKGPQQIRDLRKSIIYLKPLL